MRCEQFVIPTFSKLETNFRFSPVKNWLKWCTENFESRFYSVLVRVPCKRMLNLVSQDWLLKIELKIVLTFSSYSIKQEEQASHRQQQQTKTNQEVFSLFTTCPLCSNSLPSTIMINNAIKRKRHDPGIGAALEPKIRDTKRGTTSHYVSSITRTRGDEEEELSSATPSKRQRSMITFPFQGQEAIAAPYHDNVAANASDIFSTEGSSVATNVLGRVVSAGTVNNNSRYNDPSLTFSSCYTPRTMIRSSHQALSFQDIATYNNNITSRNILPLQHFPQQELCSSLFSSSLGFDERNGSSFSIPPRRTTINQQREKLLIDLSNKTRNIAALETIAKEKNERILRLLSMGRNDFLSPPSLQEQLRNSSLSTLTSLHSQENNFYVNSCVPSLLYSAAGAASLLNHQQQSFHTILDKQDDLTKNSFSGSHSQLSHNDIRGIDSTSHTDHILNSILSPHHRHDNNEDIIRKIHEGDNIQASFTTSSTSATQDKEHDQRNDNETLTQNNQMISKVNSSTRNVREVPHGSDKRALVTTNVSLFSNPKPLGPAHYLVPPFHDDPSISSLKTRSTTDISVQQQKYDSTGNEDCCNNSVKEKNLFHEEDKQEQDKNKKQEETAVALPSLTRNVKQDRTIFPLGIEKQDVGHPLSKFLCFVRLECIEVFTATEEDVNERLSSKRVKINQAGIRCRFCAHLRERKGRSSHFPSSIPRIYQGVSMMIYKHFPICDQMPTHIRSKYNELKKFTKRGDVCSQDYWVQSATAIGLIDTPEKKGILLQR